MFHCLKFVYDLVRNGEIERAITERRQHFHAFTCAQHDAHAFRAPEDRPIRCQCHPGNNRYVLEIKTRCDCLFDRVQILQEVVLEHLHVRAAVAQFLRAHAEEI